MGVEDCLQFVCRLTHYSNMGVASKADIRLQSGIFIPDIDASSKGFLTIEYNNLTMISATPIGQRPREANGEKRSAFNSNLHHLAVVAMGVRWAEGELGYCQL